MCVLIPDNFKISADVQKNLRSGKEGKNHVQEIFNIVIQQNFILGKIKLVF